LSTRFFFCGGPGIDNYLFAVCHIQIKAKKAGQADREERRALGLIILRGENVVSISVEAPPATEDKRSKVPNVSTGPGIGRAVGRGTAPAISAAPLGESLIRSLED
jgi:hypothetical protein